MFEVSMEQQNVHSTKTSRGWPSGQVLTLGGLFAPCWVMGSKPVLSTRVRLVHTELFTLAFIKLPTSHGVIGNPRINQGARKRPIIAYSQSTKLQCGNPANKRLPPHNLGHSLSPNHPTKVNNNVPIAKFVTT